MKLIYLLLVSIVLFSCNQSQGYQPQGLRKLSPEELIERAKNHTLRLNSISYKDSAGNLVTREDFLKLDPTQYITDLYVDTNGTVQEMVIRRATREDTDLKNQMQEAYNEGPDLILTTVDCSKIKEILQEVYAKDQGNRTNPSPIDPKIDIENQQKVVSIIEQCGFPTSEQASLSGIQAIFLVIQHASPKIMEKYFPQIKQCAARGDLGLGSVAMMEDRILMNKGLKQKYGSQVVKKGDGPWELHPIEDPANVNARRSQIGLGSIEEYLLHSGIVYKPAE